MDIVLEGPDNAGKTTLAKVLGDIFGQTVVPGEGREKFPGEMNERVRRYLSNRGNDHLIYDRHPVVSEDIYSIVEPKSIMEPELIREFYAGNVFFIYCRPLTNHLKDHGASPRDDDKFLTALTQRYSSLVSCYDTWALNHANIVYRIGDNMEDVIQAIKGLVSFEFDPVRDIAEFHHKFQLMYNDIPRLLPDEISDFRIDFMREELDEYQLATSSSQVRGGKDVEGITHDLEKMLDAMVDLVYVALGTSYLHGFNFRTAWIRVHQANMKKKRAEHRGESSRNSTFDVVKPEGWVAPTHRDLVWFNECRREVQNNAK